MFFIHCDRCEATLRAGIPSVAPSLEPFEDVEAFKVTHAGCALRFCEPTGRAMASGAWHEPLVERRIEVRDRAGLAIAVGARSSIEEPLAWRIEHVPYEEEIEVTLDAELFRDGVDRALGPRHLAQRKVAAWTNHIGDFLRSLQPADVQVLYDDVRRPECSAACLTPTARAPLEAALPTFGFGETSGERLRVLFEDAEFPPLWVTRHLVTGGWSIASQRAGAHSAASLCIAAAGD